MLGDDTIEVFFEEITGIRPTPPPFDFDAPERGQRRSGPLRHAIATFMAHVADGVGNLDEVPWF